MTSIRWRPLRFRKGLPERTGSRWLRLAGQVCLGGFAACVVGSMAVMLIDEGVDLIPWFGGGAFLFALLPFGIMNAHLSYRTDLSEAQQGEWNGGGPSGRAVIVALFYLLRGGMPLPPGSAKRMRRGGAPQD